MCVAGQVQTASASSIQHTGNGLVISKLVYVMRLVVAIIFEAPSVWSVRFKWIMSYHERVSTNLRDKCVLSSVEVVN